MYRLLLAFSNAFSSYKMFLYDDKNKFQQFVALYATMRFVMYLYDFISIIALRYDICCYYDA